jgi:hypothetical protein
MLLRVTMSVAATFMGDLLQCLRRDPDSVAIDKIPTQVTSAGEAQRPNETEDRGASRVWPSPPPDSGDQQHGDSSEDEVAVEHHLLVSEVRVLDPVIGNQARGDGRCRSQESNPP